MFELFLQERVHASERSPRPNDLLGRISVNGCELIKISEFGPILFPHYDISIWVVNPISQLNKTIVLISFKFNLLVVDLFQSSFLNLLQLLPLLLLFFLILSVFRIFLVLLMLFIILFDLDLMSSLSVFKLFLLESYRLFLLLS